jgi:hypothetical protein
MITAYFLIASVGLCAFYFATHALKAAFWPVEKPIEPVVPITPVMANRQPRHAVTLPGFDR